MIACEEHAILWSAVLNCENSTYATHRSVVHILRIDGQIIRHRKDDAHEQRPQYTVDVRRPSEDAVAHVERARLEVDLGVVSVEPTSVPAGRMSQRHIFAHQEVWHVQEDRNDVRQVQRHSRQRKDGVSRNGAREVKETGQNREERREPDCAQRCCGVLAHVPKVATIRQAVVPAECVYRARTSL